ncbi:gliding motility-associated C-terminal domain-containing protein [Flavobacterium sp. AS60]|uniref:gliding motility-associated C-terminal domain-containing protein n=1 Tax=Flavobacterium anseongense TaxID=2910677 RepID=UPI001F2568B4|nr:gliding motility-associated C-terminal domain-containing protein [Flavobacterium sp. AS60]MCF6130330.1 gliding motility-associated C-terminal domain-containing protein [Flavobacterium sp. AS60]
MFGKRLYLFFTFLFFAQFAQGQLSNFTLNVTATNETCPSNGRLTFEVSNTTAGSVILYSIYLLPNVTTPISVQSATTISGLSAGSYRVVATQSLGSESGTQQQDITITDAIILLTYQTTSTNEICGNDGTITVNVTTGTAASYEIFSGPMTRPSQTSNLFTGLTAGVYQIKVIDICGQAIVQTYALFRTNTDLNFTLYNPIMSTCTMASIGAGFQMASPTGLIRYPIEITILFTPPSGPSITYNQTLTSGNGFSQQVPYYPGQTSSYSITITDGCGTVYHLNGVVEDLPPIGGPGYSVAPQDCEFQLINFTHITSLILVSAPPGYVGTLPQDFTSSIVDTEVIVHDVVPGIYVFNLIDACGNPQTVTVEVEPNQSENPPYFVIASPTCIDVTLYIYDINQLIMVSAPPAYTVPLPHDYSSLINSAHYAVFVHLPVGTYVFNLLDRCGYPVTMTVVIVSQTHPPGISIREGCENGVGSFRILGDLVTISIVSAPTAYTGPVPADLTGNILSNGTILTMDNLPPGVYTFQSTNSCGGSFTTNATITGYQENTNAIITPNCGSFNLTLNHTSNNNSGATYWLQKYNPTGGNWVHPLTDAVYVDGSVPTITDSFELQNNTTTFNIAFIGHFRILKVFRTFRNDSPSQVNCFRTIYEFDFYNVPRIIDVYPVSCGATFEVVVNAVGNSALTYRIVAKNSLPFLIENGSSNLFSGLEPATYTFEVEDLCHNSANSIFQVLNPEPMTITSSVSCDGESASLTVPNFPFLTYQWWKDNNTTTILSTTNELSFPSFNSTLDNGIYHVRITYLGNPGSCLNQVLDYEILLNNITPQAGDDNTVSYCGRQGIIDMTTLLTGTFQPSGTWSEITTSGTLTNNLWDSSTVSFGTYQFKYTVSGSCSSTDDASINITIKAIPQIPTASADPIQCETQNVNLFATFVANGNYNWIGPNGFTSTLQNPVLNSVSTNENGTYTVNVTQNGCQSGNSSVEILVNPLPSFALNQSCVGKDYQVWYTRQNEASFDEANSTFSWTGPNNFTSNQSLITITGGKLGIYSLSITNQFGCEVTNTIDVARNICFIPNVITPNNDQTNESLDLTGFGVDKLEIYNRWGRKVYEKSNYSDEWHGQNMNGGILPDSTYYYIIKLDTEEIKNGWIFLTRG